MQCPGAPPSAQGTRQQQTHPTGSLFHRHREDPVLSLHVVLTFPHVNLSEVRTFATVCGVKKHCVVVHSAVFPSAFKSQELVRCWEVLTPCSILSVP